MKIENHLATFLFSIAVVPNGKSPEMKNTEENVQ